MNRTRRRIAALSASCAVAAAIFVVGWRWLRSSTQDDDQHIELEIKLASEIEPRAKRPLLADASPSERNPRTPQEWRFFLTEKEAGHFFPLGKGAGSIYDPWCYTRNSGDMRSTLEWREHPAGKIEWRYNALGCREDHELDFPSRERRVLVAGDSHTNGVCTNAESFVNLVEGALAQRDPSRTVEALNTALGGYSFLNYAGTWFRFRAFKPQVFVVAAFAGNDFSELLPVYLHLTGERFPTRTPEHEQRRKRAFERSRDAMAQGLNSIDTFRTWPELQAPVVDAALELIGEMRRLATDAGAEFVVVFIPCPFDVAWNTPPRKVEWTMRALELARADLETSPAMSRRFLDGLAAREIRTIDMTPVFAAQTEPPYWAADFHMDLRGQRLIAVELAPVVAELLGSR